MSRGRQEKQRWMKERTNVKGIKCPTRAQVQSKRKHGSKSKGLSSRSECNSTAQRRRSFSSYIRLEELHLHPLRRKPGNQQHPAPQRPNPPHTTGGTGAAADGTWRVTLPKTDPGNGPGPNLIPHLTPRPPISANVLLVFPGSLCEVPLK